MYPQARGIISIYEVTILILSVRAQCSFRFSSASSPTREPGGSVAGAAASGATSRISLMIPI
ncbi:TPA: hypothetical protein ACNC7W_005007, partial [Escherichia coli]